MSNSPESSTLQDSFEQKPIETFLIQLAKITQPKYLDAILLKNTLKQNIKGLKFLTNDRKKAWLNYLEKTFEHRHLNTETETKGQASEKKIQKISILNKLQFSIFKGWEFFVAIQAFGLAPGIYLQKKGGSPYLKPLVFLLFFLGALLVFPFALITSLISLPYFYLKVEKTAKALNEAEKEFIFTELRSKLKLKGTTNESSQTVFSQFENAYLELNKNIEIQYYSNFIKRYELAKVYAKQFEIKDELITDSATLLIHSLLNLKSENNYDFGLYRFLEEIKNLPISTQEKHSKKIIAILDKAKCLIHAPNNKENIIGFIELANSLHRDVMLDHIAKAMMLIGIALLVASIITLSLLTFGVTTFVGTLIITWFTALGLPSLSTLAVAGAGGVMMIGGKVASHKLSGLQSISFFMDNVADELDKQNEKNLAGNDSDRTFDLLYKCRGGNGHSIAFRAAKRFGI